jgi:hypothetical protein
MRQVILKLAVSAVLLSFHAITAAECVSTRGTKGELNIVLQGRQIEWKRENTLFEGRTVGFWEEPGIPKYKYGLYRLSSAELTESVYMAVAVQGVLWPTEAILLTLSGAKWVQHEHFDCGFP